MYGTELLQRSVIGEQREVAASQVGVEVVHPPHRGLHLEQERAVVLLGLLQPPAGVGDDVVLPFLIGLGENRT